MSELEVGGRRVPYRLVEGEVLEVRLLSETHVSGYGGGGSGDRRDVTIAPVRIDSTIRNRAHAVVRWSDGVEGSLEASARHALRDGHRLVAIEIDWDGTDGRAFVYNHHTKEFWIEPHMAPRRKEGLAYFPLIGGFGLAFAAIMLMFYNGMMGPSQIAASWFWLIVAVVCVGVGIVIAVRNVARQRAENAEREDVATAFKRLAETL